MDVKEESPGVFLIFLEIANVSFLLFWVTGPKKNLKRYKFALIIISIHWNACKELLR